MNETALAALTSIVNTQSDQWSREELDLAARILEKMGHTYSVSDVPTELFFKAMRHLISNPVELAALRFDLGTPRVFMVYREDKFFKGWHIPGTICAPMRTAAISFIKLYGREFKCPDMSMWSNKPELVAAIDIAEGDGPDQCPRGQEINRIYMLRVALADVDKIPLGEFRGWFPITDLPKDTLGSHKMILGYVRRHLGL